MKKRLRKKKHKQKFKEYGFEIQARFKPETSNTTHNQCFDELIEFLEQKQLMYGVREINATLNATAMQRAH